MPAWFVLEYEAAWAGDGPLPPGPPPGPPPVPPPDPPPPEPEPSGGQGTLRHMASAYLAKAGKTFPAGTSVGIYLRSQRVNGAAPQGSAITTATVAADRSLTVSGLNPGTRYSAYASVSSTPRYVDFVTPVGANNELWIPGGGVARTVDRRLLTGNVAALASGTLYLAAVDGVLPRGKTVSRVGMISGTTALSGGTHSWALIADMNRKVLAVSADDTTATLAANTRKWFNLAAPYTPAEDQGVYLGVMFVGTVPTMQGVTLNNAIASSEVPILCGSSNTSQTTPPAVGATLTAITATALLGSLTAA